MFNRISSFITEAPDRIGYSIVHMNLTQWAVVASLAVIAGFLALRTRL
jgi:hypothetical protein